MAEELSGEESIVKINTLWMALGNMGGATTEEGKSAKDIECIVADAGARSQGAMAGTSNSALVLPSQRSLASPYVGWLAGGWALLLGQKAGSELGSQVGSVFNDC